MQHTLKLLITLLLVGHASLAQMTLNFPTERSVFQRDINNEGSIYISGSVDKSVEKIEVKLEEYKGDELLAFLGWTVIQNNSDIGSFSGVLKVKGGWYKLSVRGIINEEVYGTIELNKVGVGEVFIISGQSNAQGVPGHGGTGAKDDRVNCSDFTDTDFRNPNTDLTFRQLGDDADIGPLGLTPWCWGQVGDSLVARLGVPIMFFNAALTRTSSSNWYESSVDLPTKDAIFQGLFAPGAPYQYLNTTIKQYASIFGLRSILWHQGETDTYPGVPVEETLYGYYKGLIENIRKDFGQNMAWMFSRVSFSDGRTSDIVLRSHDRIINEPDFNIFEGPSTDDLGQPRFDGVHFGNTPTLRGLEQLAGSWLDKLDSGFFGVCLPIISNPMVDLEINCTVDLQGIMTLSDGQSVFKWNDGNEDTIRVGQSGVFWADVFDAKGNSKISQAVNLSAIRFESPNVSLEKDFVCEGEKLLLKVENGFENISWSSEESGETIEVSKAGTYNYIGENAVGCIYQSDDQVINEIEEPEFAKSPTIILRDKNGLEVENVTVFCTGESFNLTGSEGFDAYIWSDGFMGQNRILDSSATLFFKGSYFPGCLSHESEAVSITQIPMAKAPKLVKSGKYEISILDGNPSNKVNWFVNGSLVSETTATIKIVQDGLYKASIIENNNGVGCLSALSEGLKGTFFGTPVSVAYFDGKLDVIQVETSVNQTNVKIKIVALEGREVGKSWNIPLWNYKISIPTRSLATGIYIVTLESDQTILRERVFVSH
ncbi:MAG: hypothetical protein ACI97P_001021 [Arcticibacterium sp.]|jgi:hypothetical protein